jgi:hypothetical protein
MISINHKNLIEIVSAVFEKIDILVFVELFLGDRVSGSRIFLFMGHRFITNELLSTTDE